MCNIGIIPIRAKSVRLPGKTFKMVAGKQLIDWTIDACIASLLLDEIVVITSCNKVIDYCKDRRLPFIIRPKKLETDKSPLLDTIRWLNDFELPNNYDMQILLQITNPTRTSKDIDTCIEQLESSDANSICSVVDVGEFHPSRMFKPVLENELIPLLKGNHWYRTQDLSSVLMRDGSIYAWKRKAFDAFNRETLLPQQIIGHRIDISRSVRVDTQRDLDLAEKVLTSPNHSLHL